MRGQSFFLTYRSKVHNSLVLAPFRALLGTKGGLLGGEKCTGEVYQSRASASQIVAKRPSTLTLPDRISTALVIFLFESSSQRHVRTRTSPENTGSTSIVLRRGQDVRPKAPSPSSSHHVFSFVVEHWRLRVNHHILNSSKQSFRVSGSGCWPSNRPGFSLPLSRPFVCVFCT